METYADLTKKLLNDSSVRKAIADRIPAIRRLESLEELHDLRLTEFDMNSSGEDISSFSYEANISPKINARELLLDYKTIYSTNISIYDKSETDEFFLLSFRGNLIQVRLRLRYEK